MRLPQRSPFHALMNAKSPRKPRSITRSEEHTSELQSQSNLVCRLLLEKKNTLLFTSPPSRLVIRGFLQSYQTLPLNGTLSLTTLDRILTHGIGDMFVASLQTAGPLLAVLFCADLALGLLNRAAPALNAFSLGFPAKILLVLSLGGAAIGLLPKAIHALIVPAVEAVLPVCRGPRRERREHRETGPATPGRGAGGAGPCHPDPLSRGPGR